MTITCPHCGRTSANPHDVENRYCGNCHLFLVVVEAARREVAAGGTHECNEWGTALGVCALCGRELEVRIRTGDRVLVSAHGQTDVAATVLLASGNGRSLMLSFPGGLFRLVDAGAYVGTMPVLRQDDGTWIEIINQRPITVRLVNQ